MTVMTSSDISLLDSSLEWCHNVCDCASNHRRLLCLLSSLFRRGSKKKIKVRRHLPLWGDSIGYRGTPWHRNCFHLIASSGTCAYRETNCVIWLIWHHSNCGAIVVVADGLVPLWRWDICNHHGGVDLSGAFQNSAAYWYKTINGE